MILDSYIATGVKEYLLMLLWGVDFVILLSDSCDRHISDKLTKSLQDKLLIIFEECDESSKKLTARLIEKFYDINVVVIDFKTIFSNDIKSGFDVVDAVNRSKNIVAFEKLIENEILIKIKGAINENI